MTKEVLMAARGRCVFKLDWSSEDGIMLQGNMTHGENGNVFSESRCFRQAIHIGDVFYTMSDDLAHAHQALTNGDGLG
jgi:hypothetical protein